MSKELPLVDDDWRMERCKMGKGNECCRYLVMGTEGFECAKDSSLAPTLDSRVANGHFVSQGDNCDGYQVEKAKLN